MMLYEKGGSIVKRMTQHRARETGRRQGEMWRHGSGGGCGAMKEEGDRLGMFLLHTGGKLMLWKPGEPFISSVGDLMTPITWRGWMNNCMLCWRNACVCVHSACRRRGRDTHLTLICLPSTIQLPATSCLQLPSHRYCSQESWVWPAWEEELWERDKMKF